MVATILLFALLLSAAATDLAWHKIYNWNTYPGILAAWGLNALGTIWLRTQGSDDTAAAQLAELGWVGLGQSLLGFIVCGLIVLVCYCLFKIGGGDVKLIAMMGALLGLEQGLMAMLWTFVIGGCVGLIVLVWRVGPCRLLVGLGHQVLWLVRLGRLRPLSLEERAKLQPPMFLAPSALAAAVIVQFGLAERYF